MITGAESREQLYLRHLRGRRAAISDGWHADERRRWLPLVAAIDSEAIKAPEYPQLAEQLSAAFKVEVNVDLELPRLLDGHGAAGAIEGLRDLTAQRCQEIVSRALDPPPMPMLPRAPWVDPSQLHVQYGIDL